MKTLFLEEAFRELDETVRFYNGKRVGLGFEFASEIRKTIERIKKYPSAWPVISANIRRSLVNRFPYAVLYSMIDGSVLIVAIMHLRRKPGYWKNRESSQADT